MICIQNGLIHNAITKEAFTGDILIEGGKILEIGKDLGIQAGLGAPEESGQGSPDCTDKGGRTDIQVIDATGLQVYPGFVEAHGHIGLDGYGIGYEGMDYNEMNDIVCPQLRGIDGVKPLDPAFAMAAAAGVRDLAVPMCWGEPSLLSRRWEKGWRTW